MKKTPISDFKNINKSGLIAINLKDGDELIGVNRTSGEEDIILVTENGMSIRFNENDVRGYGKNSDWCQGYHPI